MHHTLVLWSADATALNLKRRRTVALTFTVRTGTSTLQAPYLFHQSQHSAVIRKVRAVCTHIKVTCKHDAIEDRV